MKSGFHLLTALFGSAVFALSGCGDSSTAPTSTLLNGTAMAGPFLSGQVCAYQVTNGAKGALLGSCTPIVAATSSFSVDIGTYTGDVLVEVSNATYDDEANPSDNTTGTPLTGSLRNLIHVGSAGATVTLAVTPLTEAALKLAGANLDNAHVLSAIDQLAGLLPTASGLDLRLTPPLATTTQGLAYREALRALSQLQWGSAGTGQFAGHLDTFLGNLVGQMGGSNTLATDLLGQINLGLNSSCALANGALSCSVTSGGGNNGGTTTGAGSVTCNTAHYTSGAVHLPTANELAAYAKTYSGNTGTFDMSGFTANGSAVFVLNASGTLTYNGATQTVNSICADSSLPMIYVEFGTNGGVDFFSDGSFTGNLSDGTGVSSVAGNGGGNASKVSSFTPSTGAVGTTVTISGTNLGNFTPAPLVKFGTTTATVSSASATSIVVTVPAGLAAGSVAIALSNFDGTGSVSVGNYTVTGGGTTGGGTGSGGNTTTGTAVNGTPAFDPSKCASSISLGSAGAGLSMTMYLACGANAVADFSGVSMVDFTDGKTCTASYSAGMLTVVKGPLTASAAFNGEKGSDSITTLSNGTTETISTLSPQDKTSATSNTVATVTWNTAGVVKQIQGGATAIGGVYQTFNCYQP